MFILDEVFASFPRRRSRRKKKKLVADNVYAHVWQQAMSGEFASILRYA